MGSLSRLLAELRYDLSREALQNRKRRREAQKEWANTPAPTRSCPKCKEIAFTPGQVACAKCGTLL
jgi:hypothetical protein